MPKYQLTEPQKNILRAASKGLRDGAVKTAWTWYTMQSDTSGDELALVNGAGFPNAKKLGVKLADLTLFVQRGFLHKVDEREYYHVHEQAIHDAVDNDFEIPDHLAHSTTLQTNIYGNVTGSNINTAQYMDNISQKVERSEFLSSDVQEDILNKVAELQQTLNDFEETHTREIREVNRSLDIVIEDLTEGEPDIPNVTGLLERLKRAGEKLIFAPLAMALVSEIADRISSVIQDITS